MSFRRIIVVALLMTTIVGGYCFIAFLKHERAQNDLINSLQAQISILDAQVDSLTELVEGDSVAAVFRRSVSEGFDYLAIGNSITQHPIREFWWGEWGMAASKSELDYYHLVVNGLNEIYGNINTASFNFSVWEVQSHDRSETFEFLDQYRIEGIDLITVQLSENCSNIDTFPEDFSELLTHISNECGEETRIIVIDDFWSDERNDMKETVCTGLGIEIVDLSDICGLDLYQAGLGSIVFGEDDNIHTIDHEGVAAHPGDKAMSIIANRVLSIVCSNIKKCR